MSTTATTTTTDTPPTYRAQPCRECGMIGGRTSPTNIRPARVRGYCLRCYYRHLDAGTLPADAPPSVIYADEAEMLWHTPQLVRQAHAVYPGLDRAAVAAATAACERAAARWLLDHPTQARPDLAGDVYLFGGEERAA